jgi:hypothetical protein
MIKIYNIFLLLLDLLLRPFTPAAGVQIPLGTPPIKQSSANPCWAFFIEPLQDIPLFKRDSRSELVLSEAEGNPLGDAATISRG